MHFGIRRTTIFVSYLIASADLHLVVALFALDKAAPMKLAPTSLLARLSSGGVSPIAAHELAAVYARAPLAN